MGRIQRVVGETKLKQSKAELVEITQTNGWPNYKIINLQPLLHFPPPTRIVILQGIFISLFFFFFFFFPVLALLSQSR